MITPIGLDHIEWLGDTLEDIALAKAGIIHKGATLICAAQPAEAMAPILRHVRRGRRHGRPGGQRVRRHCGEPSPSAGRC